MAVIRIARHAESTWNAAGRYQGRLETPLSELGRAQAQALADDLRGKGIRRIVSSPLERCRQTAQPLATAIGIDIETDPLLIEIAHGTWEGRYRDEIARSEPLLYRQWRERPECVRFAGGERLEDVAARWKAFAATFRPDADTLVMTHDVVLRLAILERTGQALEELRNVRALNACYAQFETADGYWALRSECAADHLAGLTADPSRQAL